MLNAPPPVFRRTQPTIVILGSANIPKQIVGVNLTRIQFFVQLQTSGVNVYIDTVNPLDANSQQPLSGIQLSSKGQTISDTPLALPGCVPSVHAIYTGPWWAISDTAGAQLLFYEDTAVPAGG